MGSFRRSALFHDELWRAQDLNHHFEEQRSHMTYADSTRLPMFQERLSIVQQLPPLSQEVIPTPLATAQHQFTSTLLTITLPILTQPPPLPQAPIGVRLLVQANPNLMNRSSFKACE